MEYFISAHPKIWVLAILSLLSTCLFAQEKAKLSLGEQVIYKVFKTGEPMTIDGKLNEESWSKTEARTLDYFYRVEKPTDQQKSTFRMLWGEEKFYVFFEMEDQYITAKETKRDGQPYFDDCAEIFFITAPDSLDTHFGYELNLNKAVNDFIYFNDYTEGKDVVYKSFNPDFEVEVTYNGTINDNSDIDKGWTMEMAIPYSNFGELGEVVTIKPGNRWAFLAIRQDRNDAKGNRRSTSTIFPIYDISKNVHQANRFGLMEFVE